MVGCPFSRIRKDWVLLSSIVDINKALNRVISEQLDGAGVDIRFDLPEYDRRPTIPTISVFLYGVHEDLQLRRSEMHQTNKDNLSPGLRVVHLNLNYLITYWEPSPNSEGEGPQTKPDNQATRIIMRVLQALLNNRELIGITDAYTRIIPPQESLHSLGNFWQALGNRPRLTLIYSITFPMLLRPTPSPGAVQNIQSNIYSME